MFDLSDFELYLMREERSDNTISCYLRDVKGFLVWYGEEARTVNEFTLIAYKKHLIATEKTIITSNRKLASVNAFCRYLYDARIIREAYTVKLTKNRDKSQYKGVPEDGLRLIREDMLNSKNQLHICIIEVLLGTGIRVSELAGLTINDIHISEDSNYLRIIGKGTVNRTMPLNKATREAIEEYLKVRKESKSDRLLIGQRGPVGRGAIYLILKQYGEKEHVKTTPHMLRHSLAYNLIKNGTPMTTIQQILGHESILTTNLYCQTTEQDKVEALEAIEW
jgi:Site-specific recombinase XerD